MLCSHVLSSGWRVIIIAHARCAVNTYGCSHRVRVKEIDFLHLFCRVDNIYKRNTGDCHEITSASQKQSSTLSTDILQWIILICTQTGPSPWLSLACWSSHRHRFDFVCRILIFELILYLSWKVWFILEVENIQALICKYLHISAWRR